MVGLHLSSLLVTEVQKASAQMSRGPGGLHRKTGAAEGHQEEPVVQGSHLGVPVCVSLWSWRRGTHGAMKGSRQGKRKKVLLSSA